jgi:hypothetical protein
LSGSACVAFTGALASTTALVALGAGNSASASSGPLALTLLILSEGLCRESWKHDQSREQGDDEISHG